MKSLIHIAFLSLVVIFNSCKEDKQVVEDKPLNNEITTLYFIRHAEKDRSNPNDADPELTQAGLGRAMHWAEILKDAELDVIYSTDFSRTSMTAAPSSVKQNIDVKYYSPDDINVTQFTTDHLNQNVLIVGHSNSTPELVNKFLGEEKYAHIDDHENGNLFVVKIINGVASSSILSINCNCPD